MGLPHLMWLVYIFFDVTTCTSRDKYPYSVDLNKKLTLSWRVSYQYSRIYFQVKGQISPFTWFGVGFSDYGEMTHADLVVCWTSKEGVHHFQDTHTDRSGFLWPDQRQNYHLQTARMEDKEVALQFYRKFDTCDDKDYHIDNGTTHVVFFTSDIPRSSLKHVNISNLTTGLQRVQLLKPEVTLPKLPDDATVFEITAPKVQVPAVETTYWWYVTKLPPMRERHHIVKYEGIIDGGSENLVHHMEVFHCEVPADQVVRHYNGPGQSEGMPTKLEFCRKVIGAWAMGAKPLFMPEEAGVPIGGPDYSRYVLLEVHYNNPEKIAGRIDSSGIRFYVTSRLRKYDSGIMELGLEYTNKMALPPGQETFPLTGYCIKECTQIGDDLITVCEDRTTARSNATIGGFAISDEMCVNYVHYYPLVNLEVCKSSISSRALDNFFNFMNKWDLATTAPEKGDRANYNSIRWTPLTGLLLNTLYHTSPIDMQCNHSDGRRFPGDWRDMRTNDIMTKLPVPERKCHNQKSKT